jgi:hypothetical protein
MSTSLIEKSKEFKRQSINDVRTIYQAYRRVLQTKDQIGTYPEVGTYPEEGPITSSRDEQVIDSIIEKQDYVIINSGKSIYTVGLWMLYGLPELVFDVKYDKNTPVASNVDDLDDLSDRETSNSEALTHRLNRIIDTYIGVMPDANTGYELGVTEITRMRMIRTYDQQDQNLCILGIDEDPDVTLRLKRVGEEDYMGLDADYMLWFYTYYMRADNDRNIMVQDKDSVIEKDDGVEYHLYPIYRTSFRYSDFNNSDPGVNVNDVIDQFIGQKFSDFTESDNGSVNSSVNGSDDENIE